MGATVRKPLMIVIACVLIISVFAAGCSSNNNNSKDNNDKQVQTPAGEEKKGEGLEPITISVFNEVPGQTPPEDNKIFQKIKNELGVTLKQEFLVGDLEQKIGVMIAGEQYPDLISADTKLVAAGAMIPLEDLIEEHAPNLKKHYANYLNMMKDPEDGHIYWLPNYGIFNGDFNETWYAGPAFWIQKDVLREFGYPEFNTLDEYFDLIKKYKDKYPTIDGQPTIGFTSLAYDWRTFGLKNPPQHLVGYPNDGDVIVENNVATIFADKDIAKRYYKKLNDMNALGLIDKEAFSQNYDNYLAKLSSGRVLAMFDQHWNFQQAEDSLITQEKIERTYVGFPLVYDDSITDWYRDRPPLNLNNGYGITKKAQDPVRIIKFLDALMSEEWQKVLQWGIEGEDYLVDDNGMFYRTQEMRDQQVDPAWKLANKAEVFLGQMPQLQGTYSDGNATDPGSQPQEFFDGLKPLDKEILEAYGHTIWTDFFTQPPENPVHYAAWQIDLIDGSEASVAGAKLNDLALKYLPLAILAEPSDFENVWASYVADIAKVNVKAYEDRINDQIKWRVENWSK